jgi:gamma-glutamylcyclotransferase (GGCT)/AIG2-like uncharacterized protein YtfP
MKLAIFVYGTLKRGQENHDEFCRGAVAVQEGVTLGRLYHLAAGYPALAVAPEAVLGRGSADPAADLALQLEWDARLAAEQGSERPVPAAGAAPLVFGERIEFDDPAARLPSIDSLEGFRPGRRSLYDRVLVRTWVGEARVQRPAWTYVQRRPRGAAVSSGKWPE